MSAAIFLGSEVPRGLAVGESAGPPRLAARGRLRARPGLISSPFVSPCEITFPRTPFSSITATHEVILMSGGGRELKRYIGPHSETAGC